MSGAVRRRAPLDPTTSDARIRVRPALPEDVTHAAALFDAYRVFYGERPNAAAARAFLAARLARHESIVLLATVVTPDGEDGRRADRAPVGFAQLYGSFSSVSLGTVLVLNDLYVAPAERRAGVARALVREAMAYAARAGAVRLTLATQRTNAPALALYRSLGFVADDEFVHLSLACGAAGAIRSCDPAEMTPRAPRAGA